MAHEHKSKDSSGPKGDSVGYSRVFGLVEATALGLAISLPVAFGGIGQSILAISGAGAARICLLTALLFLPILRILARYANEVGGGGNPYRYARRSGSNRVVFVVGWLMLLGHIALTALLARDLARSVSVVLDVFLRLPMSSSFGWSTVVVGLAGINELLFTSNRWRTRTFLVWGIFALLLGVLFATLANEAVDVRPILFPPARLHSMSSVALLAAALWGPQLILDHRLQLKVPERTLGHAMNITWIVSLSVLAFVLVRIAANPELVVSEWRGQASFSWLEDRFETLLAFGLVVLFWIGLSQALSSSLRLVSAMVRDGFLPAARRAERGRDGERRPILPTLALLLLVVLLAEFGHTELMGSLAALSILWAILTVLAPVASGRAVAANGKKLSVSPATAGVSMALVAFLSLVLPAPTLAVALVWAGLGAGAWILYAHRGRVLVTRQTATSDTPRGKAGFRVLACMASDGQSESLLHIGAALAKAQGGALDVLRVVPSSSTISRAHLRGHAEEEWAGLDAWLQEAPDPGVPTRSLVRMAPDPASGILETAREEGVDLVLMGWTPADDRTGVSSADVVDDVFARTPLPLVLAAGAWPEQPGRIVTLAAGGMHAPVALEVARALAAQAADTTPLLLHVAAASAREQDARKMLDETVAAAKHTGPLEHEILRASNVARAVNREVGRDDLLLVGASVDSVLRQSVLAGPGVTLAEERTGLTLLVKRAEPAKTFWWRRSWDVLSRRLPNVSNQERIEVTASMRQAARADVDFYILIFLASAIAIGGLLQNSGAVVIGAMLVAPLMSPILALGFAAVVGHLPLMRRAFASTLRGIGGAVAVSTLVSLLMPPLEPTPEILARTAPALLDLVVAIASGAAAAYAMSRKSVAAALPGVAISAALVPPLCVVGYGLATSRFLMAGGAALLFVTNLSAIVLTSGVVFLLVGFRPSRSDRGRRVRKSLVVTAASLVLLALPLAYETRRVFAEGRVNHHMRAMLRQELASVAERIQRLEVTRENGQLIVNVTVVVFGAIDPTGLDEIQQRLSEDVGKPVTLRVTVLSGERHEVGPAARGAQGVDMEPISPRETPPQHPEPPR